MRSVLKVSASLDFIAAVMSTWMRSRMDDSLMWPPCRGSRRIYHGSAGAERPGSLGLGERYLEADGVDDVVEGGEVVAVVPLDPETQPLLLDVERPAQGAAAGGRDGRLDPVVALVGQPHAQREHPQAVTLAARVANHGRAREVVGAPV